MSDVTPAAESPFALLEPQESETWFAYMRLQLRLRYEMNRQLRADSGISLSDFDILLALTSGRDGRLQLTDLAGRIGWERSRVSHHARRLQDRGLVGVTRSETDGRATDITLTPAGRQVLGEASVGHAHLIRSMFFEGMTPADAAHLTATLSRVYENLLAHNSSPGRVDSP